MQRGRPRGHAERVFGAHELRKFLLELRYFLRLLRPIEPEQAVTVVGFQEVGALLIVIELRPRIAGPQAGRPHRLSTVDREFFLAIGCRCGRRRRGYNRNSRQECAAIYWILIVVAGTHEDLLDFSRYCGARGEAIAPLPRVKRLSS